MATASATKPRAIPRDQTTPIQVVLDVCFFLVLFVTPWLISTQLKEVFNTTKNIWVGAVSVLAAMAWLTDCLLRREIRVPRGKAVFYYTLLILWSFVTIGWSLCYRVSIVEYGYQLAMFVLFMVAYCNIYDRERIENLLHFSIAAGVVTAGYGLMQYYGFDTPVFTRLTAMFQALVPSFMEPWFDFRFLILPPKPDEATKIYSFMGHRNYLAGYLVAVMPIVLSRLYAAVAGVIENREALAELSERKRQKGFEPDMIFQLLGMTRGVLVYGVSLVMMLWVVMLTHTRGSWIGLFLAFLVFFVLLNLKFRVYAGWRRSIVIICVLVGVVLAIGPKKFGPFNNPLNKETRSALARLGETAWVDRGSSAHQRLLIYRTALYIIFDRPTNFLFGTGFGTFGLNYMPYQKLVLREGPPKNFERWKSQLLPYYAKTIPDADKPRGRVQEFIDRVFEVVFNKGRKGTEHWVLEINKSIYAHNEILHFWSEIGLVGMLLATMVLFYFFKDALKFLVREPANDESLLFLGMMCSVVAVLGHNLFTFDLHLAYTSSLFWFIIAVSQRYHDRGFWVFSWAPGHSEKIDAGAHRFELAIRETAEGAVSAVAENVSGEDAPELDGWRLVLRDPKGREAERKLARYGKVKVWMAPEPGEWTARIVPPEGASHDISMDYEPSNPMARPVMFASILLAAFLVYKAIFAQALMENAWRDAFLKFRGHNFEDAFLDYKRALKYDPYRGEVLFDYGRGLMDSGRNRIAIDTFVLATQSFVDPANYHNIALCYYKEGDLVMAEKSYRTALDLNIIYEQSLSNLAYLLMDKAAREKDRAQADEWNKEAEMLLERGMKFYKSNPQFSSTLGALRAQQGKMEEAVKLFEAALKADKRQCKVWINYATVLYNTKRYTQALQAMRDGKQYCKGQEGGELFAGKYTSILKGYYHELVTKNPTDKTIITSYGRDLLDAEQYTEAQDVFRKLLTSIAPGDPTATFYLGECYFKLGYREKARTEFSRVKALLEPGDPLLEKVEDALSRLEAESAASAGPIPTGTGLPLGPGLNLPIGPK